MLSKTLLKKFFKLSLYTSFLIAVLSIIPISTINSLPYSFYLFFVLIFFINSINVWLINILLIYLFERFSNKHFRYIVSYMVCVAVFGFFLVLVKLYPPFNSFFLNSQFSGHQDKDVIAPFGMGFFINSFILFIQELVLLQDKKAKIELENAQLKIKNSEALYLQLKQQIHPHFLFNSLSILKSLISINPVLAEEYIIRLSDFLRVSISSNNENLVALKDELKLCIDFIEMQRIRFGEALKFSFEIPDQELSSGCVPVFSIQLLLENAIKHNMMSEKHPLVINISYSEGWISIVNNIQKKISAELTTKSGLSNLSERYKLLSGNDIVLKETADTFMVSLKILKDENRNH